jgi:hypothetical protein
MKFYTIDESKYETFPEEGEDVLVSDGKHFDVAWYLKSGDYKWLKNNISTDESEDFENFKVIKWARLPLTGSDCGLTIHETTQIRLKKQSTDIPEFNSEARLAQLEHAVLSLSKEIDKTNERAINEFSKSN